MRALERVESEIAVEGKNPVPFSLGTLMRDLWRTGRFWFDRYAARKSFNVDSIYWAAFHDDGVGVELLDDKARAEVESFTRMKVEQL